MSDTAQAPVTFGDVIDATPDTKVKPEIDLGPYKTALLSVLPFPPMSKALPVLLTNERGHSAVNVKRRFTLALASLNGNVKGVDTNKVKLVFRNANPGTLPITKMYVKWTPLAEETKKVAK